MNEFITKYNNHKFGNLTVVGPEEYVLDTNDQIVQKNVYCHCDCGKRYVLAGINDLLNGLTTSCGCQGRDTYVRVVNSGNMGHGNSKSGIYFDMYARWKNARARLNFLNKRNNTNLEFYSEWDDFEKFKEWSLNNNWASDMSLERKNTSIGYNPDNCYWSY